MAEVLFVSCYLGITFSLQRPTSNPCYMVFFSYQMEADLLDTRQETTAGSHLSDII